MNHSNEQYQGKGTGSSREPQPFSFHVFLPLVTFANNLNKKQMTSDFLTINHKIYQILMVLQSDVAL